MCFASVRQSHWSIVCLRALRKRRGCALRGGPQAQWGLVGLALLAVLLPLSAFAADKLTTFPRPAELEDDIGFWTRVYTEVDTDGGLLHDDEQLEIVYEVVRFGEGLSETERRERVRQLKLRYRGILLALAAGRHEALGEEEQRVRALWSGASNEALRAAAYRIRFQLGQADRFRAGLVRAGAWAPFIQRTLAEMGLPAELVALPHVESSYNPMAYSHVGAAGLWQLTRSTGRRYLRVDAVVDERLDPFAATTAAARLLKHNYSVTGSWPLALTAYNHGAAGMRRAVQQLGTRDIVTVLREYRSRTFGFASRNFYPAFLAAVDLHFNAERYFGPLKGDEPVVSELIRIPAYVKVDALVRALGVDREILRGHNPALRPSVWRGAKFVPRGYGLRVPRDAIEDSAQMTLARIAASERYTTQVRDQFYTVQPGDALSIIAGRHEVSVDTLVALNALDSRHRIRAGQVLRLPPSGSRQGVPALAPLAAAKALPEGLYEVQPGDTLSLIAARFGVSEQALADTNGVRDRHRIHAGQTLRVLVATSPTPGAILPESLRDATATATQPEPTATETASVESAEPTSAGEAANLGPSLPLAVHPSLEADPSDYSVAPDATIEVQAAETLGHYAEWLQLRAAELRRVNGMRYGQAVVIGRRLRLDFTRVSAEGFEQRRRAYHRALQEVFFSQYQITGVREHSMTRGESVWILAQRQYDIPLWLLRQYNPDLDLSNVRPGTVIAIPRVEPRSPPESSPADASRGT